jgi:hypothetical protein
MVVTALLAKPSFNLQMHGVLILSMLFVTGKKRGDVKEREREREREVIFTLNMYRPEIEKLRQELTELGATHVVTDDKLGSFETRKSIKGWVENSSLLLGLNCVGGKSATDMARYLG